MISIYIYIYIHITVYNTSDWWLRNPARKKKSRGIIIEVEHITYFLKPNQH